MPDIRHSIVIDAPPERRSGGARVAKEWNGTSIVFELTPNGGRTTLRFSHAGWRSDTDYFLSCNTTWGELMFRLKAAAEGKAPGPLFSAGGMAY